MALLLPNAGVGKNSSGDGQAGTLDRSAQAMATFHAFVLVRVNASFALCVAVALVWPGMQKKPVVPSAWSFLH